MNIEESQTLILPVQGNPQQLKVKIDSSRSKWIQIVQVEGHMQTMIEQTMIGQKSESTHRQISPISPTSPVIFLILD